MTPLLDVKRLRVRIPGAHGSAFVVDDVSFEILPGTVFGIAGESGSGKTVSVLSILGLAPDHSLVEGAAMFGNTDLLKLSPHQLRAIRGKEIGMVFQDPMTSFHPMLSIGRQLTEHARQHLGLNRDEANRRAIELLNEVRIPDPGGALHAYPHQFSGGMRQRLAIAMALMCEPKLLIADEPTTALDVTVQAGILRLLDRLRKRFNLSVLLITHDLGVLSVIADQLSIFYAGRVVESGATADILMSPRHPYTAGLLAALPHPEVNDTEPLTPIPGTPPTPEGRPSGCAFHPRCHFATPTCSVTEQHLVAVNSQTDRKLACAVDPLRGQYP